MRVHTHTHTHAPTHNPQTSAPQPRLPATRPRSPSHTDTAPASKLAGTRDTHRDKNRAHDPQGAPHSLLWPSRALPAPPRRDLSIWPGPSPMTRSGMGGPHLADQLPAPVDTPRAGVAQEGGHQLATPAPAPGRGLHPRGAWAHGRAHRRARVVAQPGRAQRCCWAGAPRARLIGEGGGEGRSLGLSRAGHPRE